MRFSWTSGAAPAHPCARGIPFILNIKAARNRLKHGVDFADAVIALEDENALTIEDAGHDEQRFKSLGLGAGLKVLLVVHAFGAEDCIRIISARKANRSEIRQYYQGIGQ
jgi:uncharacterized DUF497 family protein